MCFRRKKKICECNSSNSEKAIFCKSCDKIFCKCRKVSLLGSAYCYYCGQPIATVSIKNNEILTYNQVIEQINNYKRYGNIEKRRGIIASRFFNGNIREKELWYKHNRAIIEKNLYIFLENSIDRVYQIIKKIKDADIYLIYSDKTSFLKEVQGIHNSYLKISKSEIPNISLTASYFSQSSENALFYIDDFNNKFIERKKKEYSSLFINKGVELDDDQKRAVITDDKHNLVIAGAGSGKTEVLITRIAYLIKRKTDTINPERVLVLAFQTKAKEEIRKRIKDRYGININTETFHSFGNKILREYAKEIGEDTPKFKEEISGDKNYANYIQDIFKQEIKINDEFKNYFINYMKLHVDEDVKKLEDFSNNKEEFYLYQRNLRYTTLNDTKVKSESERRIMNFFLTHKIKGENIKILYEYPANWMEYKNNEGQTITPKPDFYFPDFDIYLEHWTIIDKERDVPEWYRGKDKLERNMIYLDARTKKIEKYKKNNKILIETSGKDFDNADIETILEERFIQKLREINPETEFKIEPLTHQEIIEKVWRECKEFVDYLPLNVSKFITIAKTYKLDPNDIEEILKDPKWSSKQVSFGKIALTIYKRYEDFLGNYIDYPKMINQASSILEENESFYKNKYDHILVDEYQDISAQRYELIKQLMRKNPNAKLFCVGDDWQSIMGFTGSNLKFFLKFKDYFPNPAKTYLPINYRSIKSIVDTGTAVIKNNKNYLDKNVISNSDTIKPIQVYSLLHKKEWRKRYYAQMASHCMHKIKEIKENENISYSDFMILLRIGQIYKLKTELNRYANQLGIEINGSDGKDYVRVMTVHGSKGLQSKYVFILNVDKDRMGFPCEIEDPSILEPAIKDNDKMREEEERRLFYVALTRAKEGVYLYNQKCLESKFISEIKNLDFVKVDEVKYWQDASMGGYKGEFSPHQLH